MDRVVVYAEGGRGGDGCVSFRREKYVPRGGPDGGDGGRGGHVIFRGDSSDRSLVNLYFNPHQRAGRGGHGKGKKLHGRNGTDLVAKVPCGTEIREKETGQLLCDIVLHGQEMIVATGGKGGLGNCHWTTPTHQAPTEHTPGEPGEKIALSLELKLIADVGLVGFPNAGKSSLLRMISHAHPKVAAYPFTTLHPVIGTLVMDDFSSITIADIPGLIRGAHHGAGLGHDFLRHIERAAALVHVVDMAGVDGRKPVDDYFTILDELGLHMKQLLSRPALVVANKMDLPDSAGNIEEFRRETKVEPIPVSAIAGSGAKILKQAIFNLFKESRQTP